MLEIFESIYKRHLWGGNESRSGPGSSLRETAAIRQAIPALVRQHKITSLLDVPCGDWNWMAHVKLACRYIGGDLVGAIIQANALAFPNVDFRVIDITAELPAADLILTRDCLVHFPFELISKAFRAIKSSGSHYVLMTHFPLLEANSELGSIGDWRPLNFCRPPFNLPSPLEVVEEGFWAKTLAMWRTRDLPDILLSASP